MTTSPACFIIGALIETLTSYLVTRETFKVGAPLRGPTGALKAAGRMTGKESEGLHDPE